MKNKKNFQMALYRLLTIVIMFTFGVVSAFAAVSGFMAGEILSGLAHLLITIWVGMSVFFTLVRD